MTSRDWRDDLLQLADGLRRAHRNLFHRISDVEFGAAVRQLDGRIPSLAPHEVVVEFAALVASIGDGHTTLRLHDIEEFHRFPIAIDHFSDGPFITAIGREHAHAAGARLGAIDGVQAEEAFARLVPLVSRDNAMGTLATVPHLLPIPEVLHARGIIADLDTATFTARMSTGETVSPRLQSGSADSTDLVDARDASEAPRPLWLRQTDRNWFTMLPDQSAIYVGYNCVRDSGDETLATFFDRVFAAIERVEARRLILDLRHNSGGNNILNLPLVHHLIRCDRINQWGSLFAIVGRHTFSAAMNLTIDLERHVRVLFVGEPTGSSPNHFGENGAAELRNSGLHISVSTLWWQYSVPYDNRPWVAPEISVSLRSSDYLGNRDPCLDAVLSYRSGSCPELTYPDRLLRQLKQDHIADGPSDVTIP